MKSATVLCLDLLDAPKVELIEGDVTISFVNLSSDEPLMDNISMNTKQAQALRDKLDEALSEPCSKKGGSK